MTVAQMLYQASRKAKSNYRQAMKSSGKWTDRVDAAQSNAEVGWNWYLSQCGLDPNQYHFPEWDGFGIGIV